MRGFRIDQENHVEARYKQGIIRIFSSRLLYSDLDCCDSERKEGLDFPPLLQEVVNGDGIIDQMVLCLCSDEPGGEEGRQNDGRQVDAEEELGERLLVHLGNDD